MKKKRKNIAGSEDRNVMRKAPKRFQNTCVKNLKEKLSTYDNISKSLVQYMANITGKYCLKDLHKTAILGTAQILREGLM